MPATSHPPVLFDGASTEPATLEEVVGQALGAASVCWESMEGTGVFQSERAAAIAAEVVAWVREHFAERPPRPGTTATCGRCYGAGILDAGPGVMDQPCGSCSGTGLVRVRPRAVVVDAVVVETSGMDVAGMPRASGPLPR